jgi:membrane-associated protease RseP (regulator of RpoE activity)
MFNHATRLICLGTVAAALAGCGTAKEKPALARGWMGGEFKVVQTFPKSLIPKPAAGVLVTALGTNTPARAAGLREGDLIVSLDHQPVGRLKDFRRKIDLSEPGTVLPVTAYRDGQTVEYDVAVGKETYRDGGVLTIGLPFLGHSFKLWPTASDPGISLVAAGYHVDEWQRKELGSVTGEYFRKCNPNDRAYDEDYNIWLVLMEVSKGKRIVAQEMVEARR